VHLGIEITTGPLGQAFANALGMALAERSLAATFNRPGHTVVDHHTYVFLGDGCMMEGISHEVASFAGMQRLGKLILVYDDNGISIDGKVKGWFADDTPRRFEAYGWHVLPPIDGHDSDSIAAGLAAARAVTDRPSLICAKTVIGWGAPHKQGTASMHGEAVGTEEIAAARERLGWTIPPFEIPAETRAGWDMREKGERSEREWRAKFAAYQAEFSALAAELERRITGDLPSGFDELANACIDRAQSEGKALATRLSSQAALNAFGPALPDLTGGFADLTPSNGTLRKDSLTLTRQPAAHQSREAGQVAAVRSMAQQGRRVRLVSMPSSTTFVRQDEAYRHSVPPPSVTRRVAMEAGVREPWWRYVGLQGQIVGIDTFGASALRRRRKNCSSILDSRPTM
jgi:transketolase